MIQFLLAAPRSGSGKTTMTCALLMANNPIFLITGTRK